MDLKTPFFILTLIMWVGMMGGIIWATNSLALFVLSYFGGFGLHIGIGLYTGDINAQ